MVVWEQLTEHWKENCAVANLFIHINKASWCSWKITATVSQFKLDTYTNVFVEATDLDNCPRWKWLEWFL